MTAKSYNFTSEGLQTDNEAEELKRELKQGNQAEREKCPEAFLLSAAEAKLLFKALDIISNVNIKYADIPEENYTAELQAQMLADYVKEFGRKRLPLKKLRNICDRVNTSLFWSISLSSVEIGKKGNPRFIVEKYKVTTSTPEQIPDSIITADTCPAYFAANNQADRARALDMPDLYLFAYKIEVRIMIRLNLFFAQLDAEQAPISKDLMTLKSAPEFDFFFDLGTNALSEATTKRKMDATGQQISITEILTRNGLTLEAEKSIDDIVSFKNPNADKLFKQLMNEAIAKKQTTIQITREEFMRVRKLKDEKEAYKQLKKGVHDLYALSVPITAYDEKGKKTGTVSTRIFENKFIPTHNGAESGYIMMEFTKKFYDSLIKNSQVIYVPTKILQIPNNKPNSYFFACKFLQRKRMQNNNMPEADNRLSVKTLLEISTLPQYKDLKDKGQFNQLIIDKFQKAFDYLELSEEQGGIGLFSYCFVKEKGKKLTNAELTQMYSDYAFFESLNIEVNWYEDIDYSNVKARHQAHEKKRAGEKRKDKQ